VVTTILGWRLGSGCGHGTPPTVRLLMDWLQFVAAQPLDMP
jgi:hypothetical protein